MKKVILRIFGVLLILIIAAAFFFRGEIKMAYNMAFLSPEQTDLKLKKSKEDLSRKLVAEYGIDQTFADGFTKEEEEKLLKGETTVDEVMNRILGENKEEKPQNNSKTETQEKLYDNQQKLNEVMKNGTANIYKIKAEYLTKLGTLEAEIDKFYSGKLMSGSSRKSAKQAVIATYLPKLAQIVNEADAQIDQELKTFEKDIKTLGGDTSIIKQIRNEYEAEKTAKQSQYKERMSRNGGY